jgi:hypothetical protein
MEGTEDDEKWDEDDMREEELFVVLLANKGEGHDHQKRHADVGSEGVTEVGVKKDVKLCRALATLSET